jgi:hypothetical protein
VGNVEEQDKRRSDFLVAVFEATEGGSSMKDVTLSEIEAKLTITYEQAEDLFGFLRGQGLVEVRAMGGYIGLTPAGRLAVEDALRQPPSANPVGF